MTVFLIFINRKGSAKFFIFAANYQMYGLDERFGRSVLTVSWQRIPRTLLGRREGDEATKM